jgi:hypothetical protein
VSNERLRELLFDQYFYVAKVQAALGMNLSGTREDIFRHYTNIGWRARINPSPYFDINWYLVTHPGLADAGTEPLEHYFELDGQKSSPHPLFDLGWYVGKYINPDHPSQHPVVHYIERGWREGTQPNALLWTDWYKKHYDIETDPFYHFVLNWHHLTLDPNPLFDTQYYCSQLPQKLNSDPLSHYMHIGCHKDFAPHVLFDPLYYAQAAACGGKRLTGNLLAHYFACKDISPCPLFNTEVYLEEIGGKTLFDVPLVDYIESGWKAGARPHGHFSPRFYLSQNDDVRQARLEPLQHYLRAGWREGRKPHPLFDPAFYTKTHPDVSGNPLVHYLTYGCRQGYSPRQSAPLQASAARLGRKVMLDISTLNALDEPGCPEPFVDHESPVTPTIGIFAHVYYPDVFDELVPYLNNVPFPCTVFITTCDPLDAVTICALARAGLKHPFEVKVVENRGRDIAPLIVHCRSELRKVDLGLHVHTKKSLHYASEFASWRTFLFQHNLGSAALVRQIIALLQNDHIGAVAPCVYDPLEPLINWGGNFDTARDLLAEAGERLWSEQPLEFPAGSMFWFKTKALDKLLSLHLDAKHFEPEKAQIDGTLAHAIERSFFYFVEAAGFSWLLLSKGKNDAKPADWIERLAPQQVQCLNRMLIRADESDIVSRYYPECTSFACRGSEATRPRINMLVPTADRSLGYAGIATALDLFHSLRARLAGAHDARIICTDISPTNQYAPPAGFILERNGGYDREGVDSVVDAAQRYKFPLSVRQRDVFIATAWWTARGAFEIIEWQERFFGTAPAKAFYLIQDFECGFYPWSTKYGLADATYRQPEKTIPIFNTDILRDFFLHNGYYHEGFVLNPGINKTFIANVRPGEKKRRNILLYARPHAERNCLPFLDMLVANLVRADPDFWRDWQFLAIGERFDRAALRCTDRIQVLGRLTVTDYARLSSESALAVSLMVSPHPSYPPLEMAAAGVLVLANTYSGRDPAEMHDNIRSFTDFDINTAASHLRRMAELWTDDPGIGWRGKPRISWFFDSGTNLEELALELGNEVINLCAA